MPICQDALGRALLMAESDRDVCGIVRRANAEANGSKVVKVETFMEDLCEHRGGGFVECADFCSECSACLRCNSALSWEGQSRLGLASSLRGFPPNGAGFCSCWLAWPKRSKATG